MKTSTTTITTIINTINENIDDDKTIAVIERGFISSIIGGIIGIFVYILMCTIVYSFGPNINDGLVGLLSFFGVTLISIRIVYAVIFQGTPAQ